MSRYAYHVCPACGTQGHPFSECPNFDWAETYERIETIVNRMCRCGSRLFEHAQGGKWCLMCYDCGKFRPAYPVEECEA